MYLTDSITVADRYSIVAVFRYIQFTVAL